MTRLSTQDVGDKEVRHRRRHRQTCAFGYLTVAPITGHLGPLQAHDEHALPLERVDNVHGGQWQAPVQPVIRRVTRRVIEAVD